MLLNLGQLFAVHAAAEMLAPMADPRIFDTEEADVVALMAQAAASQAHPFIFEVE